MNPMAAYVPRRGPRFTQTWDADAWLRMLQEVGVASMTAAQWAQHFAAEVQPARFSAGMDDVRGFVTTFLHETSMLKRLSENMNYSAERIRAVWPSRFPTLASAQPYEHRPRELANKVYGGRMGNTMPGDGYAFRGRASGITGRRNYGWLGDQWGQDLLTMPDLLEHPGFALAGSFFAWEGLVPDKALSDQVQVRKVYNGGVIGLEHCVALHDLTCKVVTA